MDAQRWRKDGPVYLAAVAAHDALHRVVVAAADSAPKDPEQGPPLSRGQSRNLRHEEVLRLYDLSNNRRHKRLPRGVTSLNTAEYLGRPDGQV